MSQQKIMSIISPMTEIVMVSGRKTSMNSVLKASLSIPEAMSVSANHIPNTMPAMAGTIMDTMVQMME